MRSFAVLSAAALLTAASLVAAQDSGCPITLGPNYALPLMRAGWYGQLIVQGLTAPRGLLFDKNGSLLVVEQGKGITHMTFSDYGNTCLVMTSQTSLINNTDLNHGIELSADGNTLYASTSDAVISWPYNATGPTVGEQRTLVSNMSNTDHVSRTLLLSRKTKSTTLLVSRGSSENLDPIAGQLNSGHSQVKAFDLDNIPQGRSYDFPSEGKLLGWGLRNDVGVAEHPNTGGIWSVENSADQLTRNGVDIHEINPAEELNFLGYLNGSTEHQGGNYGYPDCFSVWSTDMPDAGDLQYGDQFALNPNSTLNDTTCRDDYVAPTMVFHPHTAPLDIKFSGAGDIAFVTFHGSWNHDPPVGYELAAIQWDKNSGPANTINGTQAYVSVMVNANLTACPDGCFRPVGITFDPIGRMLMTSDSTGEIFILREMGANGLTFSNNATDTMNGTFVAPASASSSASGGASSPTASGSIAARSARSRPGDGALMLEGAAILVSTLLGAALVM